MPPIESSPDFITVIQIEEEEKAPNQKAKNELILLPSDQPLNIQKKLSTSANKNLLLLNDSGRHFFEENIFRPWQNRTSEVVLKTEKNASESSPPSSPASESAPKHFLKSKHRFSGSDFVQILPELDTVAYHSKTSSSQLKKPMEVPPNSSSSASTKKFSSLVDPYLERRDPMTIAPNRARNKRTMLCTLATALGSLLLVAAIIVASVIALSADPETDEGGGGAIAAESLRSGQPPAMSLVSPADTQEDGIIQVSPPDNTNSTSFPLPAIVGEVQTPAPAAPMRTPSSRGGGGGGDNHAPAPTVGYRNQQQTATDQSTVTSGATETASEASMGAKKDSPEENETAQKPSESPNTGSSEGASSEATVPEPVPEQINASSSPVVNAEKENKATEQQKSGKAKQKHIESEQNEASESTPAPSVTPIESSSKEMIAPQDQENSKEDEKPVTEPTSEAPNADNSEGKKSGEQKDDSEGSKTPNSSTEHKPDEVPPENVPSPGKQIEEAIGIGSDDKKPETEESVTSESPSTKPEDETDSKKTVETAEKQEEDEEKKGEAGETEVAEEKKEEANKEEGGPSEAASTTPPSSSEEKEVEESPKPAGGEEQSEKPANETSEGEQKEKVEGQKTTPETMAQEAPATPQPPPSDDSKEAQPEARPTVEKIPEKGDSGEKEEGDADVEATTKEMLDKEEQLERESEAKMAEDENQKESAEVEETTAKNDESTPPPEKHTETPIEVEKEAKDDNKEEKEVSDKEKEDEASSPKSSSEEQEDKQEEKEKTPEVAAPSVSPSESGENKEEKEKSSTDEPTNNAASPVTAASESTTTTNEPEGGSEGKEDEEQKEKEDSAESEAKKESAEEEEKEQTEKSKETETSPSPIEAVKSESSEAAVAPKTEAQMKSDSEGSESKDGNVDIQVVEPTPEYRQHLENTNKNNPREKTEEPPKEAPKSEASPSPPQHSEAQETANSADPITVTEASEDKQTRVVQGLEDNPSENAKETPDTTKTESSPPLTAETPETTDNATPLNVTGASEEKQTRVIQGLRDILLPQHVRPVTQNSEKAEEEGEKANEEEGTPPPQTSQSNPENKEEEENTGKTESMLEKMVDSFPTGGLLEQEQEPTTTMEKQEVDVEQKEGEQTEKESEQTPMPNTAPVSNASLNTSAPATVLPPEATVTAVERLPSTIEPKNTIVITTTEDSGAGECQGEGCPDEGGNTTANIVLVAGAAQALAAEGGVAPDGAQQQNHSETPSTGGSAAEPPPPLEKVAVDLIEVLNNTAPEGAPAGAAPVRPDDVEVAARRAPRAVNATLLLRHGSIIHAWMRASSGKDQNATLYLRPRDCKTCSDVSGFSVATTAQQKEYKFFEIKPTLDGVAELVWQTPQTLVTYIYVFEAETVFDEGIRPVHIDPAVLREHFPDNYHFRPPLGWMNDPNGVTKVGAYFHVFYQFYPHSMRAHSLHWGHAVSKDFINWVNMPVFLQPYDDVALEHEGKGGMFSGSAIPLPIGNDMFSDTGLRIFFTDDIYDGTRSPAEFQRTTLSTNGIWIDGPPERMPIARPNGHNLTEDFRDPAIFRGPDGRWQMVVGSRDPEGGVMMLYGTDDPLAASGWEYENILVRDGRFGMAVAECSGLIPLGDPRDNNTLWTLYYSRMLGVCPETGRKNLSPIFVGRFDGKRFEPIFEQELDFGTSAYAWQAFNGPDGVIGIAWLANWADWSGWKGTWIDYNAEDFPTALTLPRRIVVSADQSYLLTPPLETVVKLREHTLDGMGLKSGMKIDLPSSSAEIIVVLEKTQKGRSPDLYIALGHSTLSGLGIKQSMEGLEIMRVNGDKIRLIARGAQPSTIRLFLDVNSIEVFADGGRWTGTYRLPEPRENMGRFTSIQLSGQLASVSHVDAWKLKGAEFRGGLVLPPPGA